MVDKSVIDAFDMMWGPFPEPVMLIQKNRTILAVNDAARAAGVPLGVKCSSLNPETEGDNHCRQCKAPLALKQSQAVSCYAFTNGRHMKAYWMPLKDVPDVYVHLGINISDEMNSCQAKA